MPLFPALSLAFGRRWRHSDGRFRACEKARPQPRPAPAPARPARAPHAAHDGGELVSAAGHAAAAVAAARTALTRRACFARTGRFLRLPGCEEEPPHIPRRPDDRPAAARRRRVHDAPSPPLSLPPEIHPNTHIHPHNLLLPTPGGHPRRPPAPAPACRPVVVPRPSGGVLASLSFILKYVCQNCTSCVFPFEISRPPPTAADQRAPDDDAPRAEAGRGPARCPTRVRPPFRGIQLAL